MNRLGCTHERLRSRSERHPSRRRAHSRRRHQTPVLTCSALDALAKRSLFFKCENLQKIGAFKMRGALNAVMSLSEEAAARGVGGTVQQI